MDLMTFLKKLLYEICQKGVKNDLSMLSMAPIIINTSWSPKLVGEGKKLRANSRCTWHV